MPIPSYSSLMLPFLQIASDEKEHQFRAAVETLALQFKLSDDDRTEMLPSNTAPLFDNRVGWARTYLKQAGLIESTRRGFFRITERGIQLLKENPSQIDNALLGRYKEFQEFQTRRRDKQEDNDQSNVVKRPLTPAQEINETPEDTLSSAYNSIRQNLEADILDQVKAASPLFFERLVVDLLVKMGYGGSRQDAGRAIGRSGDEGIDGIINEDKLGLDVIYIQAKKWTSTVGRPEIQRFAGALHGKRAHKGIFITTANYSKEAEDYVRNIETKIILIDGQRLAQLMADHGVGVSTVGVFELKKVDLDYFEGE